ncbi:MAG TPA: DUF5679 domain-containing protein [Chloroflexota bacterium]|nr:DUF5679 domain-containing protein [Chloroflexota bacterium]
MSTTTDTAYCVKCAAQREYRDPQQVRLKNGRAAINGVCAVCGTRVFKIASSDKVELGPPSRSGSAS